MKLKDSFVVPVEVDRFNELFKMVQFLGTRKDYLVKQDSFLDGLCIHYTLFHGKNLRPVVKIANEYNKYFSMVEY